MIPGLSRREWLFGLGLASAAAEAHDVTPADQFFVRDHFPDPQVTLAGWSLRVEGRVTRPLNLTFSDLLEAPGIKLESVLECAGNGAGGNGVSAGVWQGVSLAQLLKDAGADPTGPVLLEGSDAGQLLKGRPQAPYRRVVPQSKCRAPESMVALQLNGRFLPHANGFPARAILPGWYAMDSVKWLPRIVVLGRDEMPPNYAESGMGELYHRLRKNAEPYRIERVLVKSMITDPRDGAKLPAAGCQVRGYAWTGEGVVTRVQVSVDGGKLWSPARLETRSQPFTWVRWNYAWQASSGDHILMSRAWDSGGNSQPVARDPDRIDSYELNWCSPVRCAVK